MAPASQPEAIIFSALVLGSGFQMREALFPQHSYLYHRPKPYGIYRAEKPCSLPSRWRHWLYRSQGLRNQCYVYNQPRKHRRKQTCPGGRAIKFVSGTNLPSANQLPFLVGQLSYHSPLPLFGFTVTRRGQQNLVPASRPILAFDTFSPSRPLPTNPEPPAQLCRYD